MSTPLRTLRGRRVVPERAGAGGDAGVVGDAAEHEVDGAALDTSEPRGIAGGWVGGNMTL